MVNPGPLAIGTNRRRVSLGSREWLVVEDTVGTSHPWLRRVEYSVFAIEDGREVGPVDTLIAFIGHH